MNIYVISRAPGFSEPAENIAVRLTLDEAKDRALEAIKADGLESNVYTWERHFDIDRNQVFWHAWVIGTSYAIEEFDVPTPDEEK